MKQRQEIEEIIKKRISEEVKAGSNVNHFMIYANMSREMAGIHTPEEIYEMWVKNREMMCLLDEDKARMRESTHIENLKNFEIIEENIDKGGFIISFHYGNYRAVAAALIEKFEKDYSDKVVNIVVDRASFGAEPELYKHCDNIKYLVSEDMDIGIKMVEQIQVGNYVAIFLDGNSGYLKDRNPFIIKFMTSTIQLRSGVFRIMELLKKPVYTLMASGDPYDETVTVGENIYIDNATAIEMAEKCYEIFLKKMDKAPEYWRLWYRHDKQVIDWNDQEATEDENSEKKWSEIFFTSKGNKVVFDVYTGKLAICE